MSSDQSYGDSSGPSRGPPARSRPPPPLLSAASSGAATFATFASPGDGSSDPVNVAVTGSDRCLSQAEMSSGASGYNNDDHTHENNILLSGTTTSGGHHHDERDAGFKKDDDGPSFGKSQFRGKDGLGPHLKRWLVQFIALFLKNAMILWRKKLHVLLMLLVPSMVLVPFIAETVRIGGGGGGDSDTAGNSLTPIKGLGECPVYFASACTRVVYGPRFGLVDDVMKQFSTINGLQWGDDVIGFDSVGEAKSFVANRLGEVQFTVFFYNFSMWEPSYKPALPKNMSYTIFYNESLTSSDSRSKTYGVNFPVLTMQKTLDEAYMRVAYPSNFVAYEVDYSTFWALPFESNQDYVEPVEVSNATSTSPCDWSTRRNSAELGFILPLTTVFAFLLFGAVPFQLLAEEKRKKLFSSLRRLGLLDSAYWASWFLIFQIILCISVGIALLVYLRLRLDSSALKSIDIGVIGLLLWSCGTGFLGIAFFMSAFCSSTSITSALMFAEFVAALGTVAGLATPLNTYATNDTDGACFFEPSIYNRLYSGSDNSFFEFLAFLVPWFHSVKAITDIMSIVQYEGQKFSVDFIKNLDKIQMGMITTSGNTAYFDSPWLVWSILMLVFNCVMYLVLAWLVGQLASTDVGEGRSVESVLLPAFLRRWLFGSAVKNVEDGDIRGAVQLKSLQERSIRGYKVSKTFKGTQALKEVSFTMNSGEVFVLLGHNGAGKSTLINILTGILQPTHGKVFIMGMDAATDAAEMQQAIGVCAQDDILWDDLTAREHMLLTAAFKGLRFGVDLTSAVNNVLSRVQLLDRSNDFAKHFSGGMKRRLSVAMSTVGDVDVLVLDEPTTGLDPLSRRRVWETVMWMKRLGCVIILTTHNMEEADFLSDTIMIMHNGHVRALGDSLFLKDTYGRGYQMHMVIRRKHRTPLTDLVKTLLPNAEVELEYAGMETEKSSAETEDPEEAAKREDAFITLTVTVPRDDVMGFPRLFSWLEKSPRAATIVKEWGITNTTLEEVFLHLCAQNKEINYVDPEVGQGLAEKSICPICRLRKKATVVCMRTLSGHTMLVPDSLCFQCAASNTFYRIPESVASELATLHEECEASAQSSDADPAAKYASYNAKALSLLIDAQSKAENAVANSILAREKGVADHGEIDASIFSDRDWKIMDAITDDLVDGVDGASNILEAAKTAEAAEPAQSRPTMVRPTVHTSDAQKPKGFLLTVHGQVHAIMAKNYTLQSRQRCSNICSAIFVAVMFLFLYATPLMFTFTIEPSYEVCGEYEYRSSIGCTSKALQDHIFSGSTEDMGDLDEPMTVASDLGYNVQSLAVPSNYAYILVMRKEYIYDYKYYQLPAYGLQYSGRSNIVWRDGATSDSLSTQTSVSIIYRRPPKGANTSLDAPNEYFWASQAKNQHGILNSDYPDCPGFSQEMFIPGTTISSYDVQNFFANYFADASFLCPTCNYSSNEIKFVGSYWVTEVSQGYSNCYSSSDRNCYLYPHGFINHESQYINGYYYYMDPNVCPAQAKIMDAASQYNYYKFSGKTAQASAYLNYLSNIMVRPDASDFPIQTGYTSYGKLTFGGESTVAVGPANVLTLIGMFLMNAFWPMTVWRLAHERSQDIVLMMKTVGMLPSSYLFGMFCFDMLVSSIAGAAMITFATVLKLALFDGAPIDYLVAVVVLSAWALNGLAVVLVRLLDKKSSAFSMASPCFLVIFVAASSVLNSLVFPKDGDWPWWLSICPFFAQSRALYILLINHEPSDEVFIALGLLLIFGGACVLITYLLEIDSSIFGLIKWLCCFMRNTFSASPRNNMRYSKDGIEEVRLTRDYIAAEEKEYHGLDEDVALEKRTALGYSASRGRVSDESLAIVIQKLSRRFPRVGSQTTKSTSTRDASDADAKDDGEIVAVRELSLALPYGECFGLLGPNGAGKSTTMSILCGALQKSGGDVYLHGHDITMNPSAIHEYVGMCPQFDVVWNDLTVAEHLAFQARQRGTPEKKVRAVVQQAAISVGLDGDSFDTAASKLSGGMRRRLSIAMSIVGDPPIIFMDEPTTGLDPDNRQHVWQIIQRLKSPRRLIVLTTHSMEEAEALCTRIGIVAAGELRCIGTAQHLKLKIGKGYFLTVNLISESSSNAPEGAAAASDVEHAIVSPADVERQRLAALVEFVTTTLGRGHPDTKLINAVNRTKKFKIAQAEGVCISEIFRLMELNKDRLYVREWGLSMSTLEDVFIAATQSPEEQA